MMKNQYHQKTEQIIGQYVVQTFNERTTPTRQKAITVKILTGDLDPVDLFDCLVLDHGQLIPWNIDTLIQVRKDRRKEICKRLTA